MRRVFIQWMGLPFAWLILGCSSAGSPPIDAGLSQTLRFDSLRSDPVVMMSSELELEWMLDRGRPIRSDGSRGVSLSMCGAQMHARGRLGGVNPEVERGFGALEVRVRAPSGGAVGEWSATLSRSGEVGAFSRYLPGRSSGAGLWVVGVPGVHDLKVEAQGYFTAEAKVRIRLGALDSLSIEMQHAALC
jgi:hypothetical protein